MCFDSITTTHSPYKGKQKRYKVLEFHENWNTGALHLRSPYYDSSWKVGKRYRARRADKSQDEPENFGFHVYLTKAAAMVEARDWGSNHVVAEMQVDKFLAAGPYNGVKAETWKEAAVVKIISLGGRDITKRFV